MYVNMHAFICVCKFNACMCNCMHVFMWYNLHQLIRICSIISIIIMYDCMCMFVSMYVNMNVFICASKYICMYV